jgi:hypothetical protein
MFHDWHAPLSANFVMWLGLGLFAIAITVASIVLLAVAQQARHYLTGRRRHLD